MKNGQGRETLAENETEGGELTSFAESFLHHLDAPEAASHQYGDGKRSSDVGLCLGGQRSDGVNAWVASGEGCTGSRHCGSSDQGFFDNCFHMYLSEKCR